MIKEEIKSILEGAGENGVDFNKVVALICNEKISLSTKQKYIDEYNLKHEILKRPDKIVKRKVKDESGKIITMQVPETVARVVLAYQKKIVEYAVTFLFGKPVNIESKESDAFQTFKDVWKALKINTLLKDVCRRTMIETEAAIIFYPEIKTKIDSKKKVIESKKLRAKVLCYKYGDEIFPCFDEYGDMVAFTRKYEVHNVKTRINDIHYDVFFDDAILKAVKINDNWSVDIQYNPAGKIPVIYFARKEANGTTFKG